MRVRITISLLALALGACATDSNRAGTSNDYEQGLRAEAAKNYPTAREAFQRALANARSGSASPQYVSAVTYNLGRMTGYLCDYAQAESLLVESLKLEQALAKPGPGNITKRLSELARLSYDMGKFAESVAYFERAVPELERLGVLKEDPVGYARFLEDYADAAEKGGDIARADMLMQRAAAIRTEHTGRRATFRPVYYREACGKYR